MPCPPLDRPVGRPTWVAPVIIQAEFNRRQIWDDALAGKYRLCIRDYRAVKEPKSPEEPPGTHWLLVRVYTEKLALVAEVGFYLRPDGAIGGKGKPDPKRLVIGDQLLRVPHAPPPLHFSWF